MQNIKIIIELTRLNKPIGFMLLFWPCLWGLTLSYNFNLTLHVFILYGLFAHAVSIYFVQSSFSKVWLQRGFAIIFASLGAKLFISVS